DLDPRQVPSLQVRSTLRVSDHPPDALPRESARLSSCSNFTPEGALINQGIPAIEGLYDTGASIYTEYKKGDGAHASGRITAFALVLVLTRGRGAAAEETSLLSEGLPTEGKVGVQQNAAVGGGELVRVGRWMLRVEHDAMKHTGVVQEGAGGTTYVAHPSNPAAYGRQAAPGTGYVEFDVPRGSLHPAGEPGWAQIPGPNSMRARLALRRGLPAPQFRPALNIQWLMEK
ncbi:hypothetical protein, partial [Streptomyces sp. NRRL F-5122]|uniref:TreTu family toxin n=1 Tax=Streptomyces sp. NRRL F-5122 TaxID=1609098 RepID=UPI000AB23536